MCETLRLLDELIERMEKFWPGSAEVAQLETLRRDLMAERFFQAALAKMTIPHTGSCRTCSAQRRKTRGRRLPHDE